MPDLSSQPLWVLALAFIGAAVVVWWSGTRLAGYVDAVAEKSGIGQAFAGMLLLGGITGLPELATVTSAAAVGTPDLAVNNVLGSTAVNVLLLAIGDLLLGRDALTSIVAKPTTLLQGVLGMLLLAAAAAAVVTGDLPLFGLGVGAWTSTILALVIGAFWISAGYERRHVWEVIDPPDTGGPAGDDHMADLTYTRLIPPLIGVAALILVAGTVLSLSGDAIAQATGLGTGLVGFVLVAFGTSLPELSAIIAAMRRRRYEMAVGDIFGSNLFNVALLFVADVAAPGGPVLNGAGKFETISALLALSMTGIFVLGLLERRDRTVLRMGYDSLGTIILYAGALIFLARMPATA